MYTLVTDCISVIVAFLLVWLLAYLDNNYIVPTKYVAPFGLAATAWLIISLATFVYHHLIGRFG